MPSEKQLGGFDFFFFFWLILPKLWGQELRHLGFPPVALLWICCVALGEVVLPALPILSLGAHGHHLYCNDQIIPDKVNLRFYSFCLVYPREDGGDAVKDLAGAAMWGDGWLLDLAFCYVLCCGWRERLDKPRRGGRRLQPEPCPGIELG